jgi:hypothetical protein
LAAGIVLALVPNDWLATLGKFSDEEVAVKENNGKCQTSKRRREEGI